MSKYESWIWAELLAFDNTQRDMGISAYLELVGFQPTGISLLLSSIDFVLLHPGMAKSTELFPDVCSRFGHTRNEVRERQKWTSYQLRTLVSGLKNRNIKVFFSIFSSCLNNHFHKEWGSSHPEMLICYEDGPSAGINVTGRLKSGKLFEDIFIPQLETVMEDYGFDGYHAADGMSYGNNITQSDPSDAFFGFFAESSDVQPDKSLLGDSGNLSAILKKRMKYLFSSEKIRREWVDFNVRRWEQFFLKTAVMLHSKKKELMINSPGLYGAVDGICVKGVDLRKLALAGIDYIVTETVAANLFLKHGGHDRHFELAAQLAELKLCLPGVKQLFLHGVKDVVESYDLLRHGTASLMREVYAMSNQFVFHRGRLQRAADGLMVCLGDGLEKHEWQFLKREWDAARSFTPVRGGELTWIFSPDCIEPLADSIAEGKREAPYSFIGRLTGEYGFQIVTAADLKNIDSVKGPCLVPFFDLLTHGMRARLFVDRKHPLVLLGEFPEKDVPAEAGGVLWKNARGIWSGCLLLNFPGQCRILKLPRTETENLHPIKMKPLLCEAVPEFPKNVMEKICITIRIALDSIPRNGGRLNVQDMTTRLLETEDSNGCLRCALLSTETHYTHPAYQPDPRYSKVEKSGSFPYGQVVIRDGLLACADCKICLPPHGIVVTDFKKINKPKRGLK